jgi:hypothetical protein
VLEQEEEEEIEGGNKEFICFMGLMMIMVVFFWIFPQFATLNFIFFLRLGSFFGFMFFIFC